jgi:hypothetical protein
MERPVPAPAGSLDFPTTGLTLRRMSSPFRDEVESLRHENALLRAELAARRGPRSGLALGLAAVDVGAALVLRPWLNAPSDGPFWGALAILGAITFTAAWAAVGYKHRAP